MGQWAIIPGIVGPKPSPSRPTGTNWRSRASGVCRGHAGRRGLFRGRSRRAMEYYPKNNAQNYGDAVEGAKTAAFRRCAKEFGVGLQAWKKDWCDSWWKAPQRTPGPPGHAACQAGHQPPPMIDPKLAAEVKALAKNTEPRRRPSSGSWTSWEIPRKPPASSPSSWAGSCQ